MPAEEWFSWVFIIYNLNAHGSTLSELYYSISISYEILFYEMHFVFGLSYCAVSMVESSKRVYESQERKEEKKKTHETSPEKKVKCMEFGFQRKHREVFRTWKNIWCRTEGRNRQCYECIMYNDEATQATVSICQKR